MGASLSANDRPGFGARVTAVRAPRGAAASSWEERLTTLQVLVGAFFVISFVAFAIWARFTVPYRDDWDWLLWVLKRPLTVGRFFEPHNEHVIVLVRLLLVVQYWVEGSRSHVIFVASLAAQLGTGWITLCEIRRRWPGTATMRYAAGVSAVILFFSFQLQSFVFMAASVFPLVQFFATAAIASALAATEDARMRPGWVIAAAVCCVAASCTTTSGIVVPIVTAMVLWCRRARWSVIAGFVLLALGTAVAYIALAGLPWEHAVADAAGPAAPTPRLGAMLVYFLTFFASGAAYANVAAATVLGTVLLAAGIVAIVVTLAERNTDRRLEVFAVGVMLFAIASVVMATPARAQFGALQAAQSRYATCSLAYWAGLFLWATSRFGDSLAARLRRIVLAATLALSVIAIVPHVAIAMVWNAKADNIAAATLALQAGVADDEWVTTLHPIPAVVYKADRALRQAGDTRFAGPIGRPVQGTSGVPACSGSVSMARAAAARDWRLAGAVDSPAVRGVVADAAGTIRGVAARAPLVAVPSPSEPDVVRVVWQSWRRPDPQRARWMGFVRSDGPSPYTLYLLDPNAKPLCRTAVEVSEPVHVWLDRPDGRVAEEAAGAGWAFQCGGGIERLTVLIDGVEQAPQRIERAQPRPDVAAAFAALCEVGASGFQFSLDTHRLTSGRHEIKARATGLGGQTAESNPHVIEVAR